jgi:hypothetical protein
MSLIQAQMRKYGAEQLPVWNTEFGFDIENPAIQKSRKRTTKVLAGTDAGAAVARSLILGAAVGVQRFYWYAWDNQLMGLSVDGARPNDAGAAYEQVRRWLTDARLAGCKAGPQGLWGCRLTLPQGARAMLLWSTQGTVMVKVPSAWAMTRLSRLDGGEDRLPADGSLELGAQPVLLQ